MTGLALYICIKVQGFERSVAIKDTEDADPAKRVALSYRSDFSAANRNGKNIVFGGKDRGEKPKIARGNATDAGKIIILPVMNVDFLKPFAHALNRVFDNRAFRAPFLVRRTVGCKSRTKNGVRFPGGRSGTFRLR